MKIGEKLKTPLLNFSIVITILDLYFFPIINISPGSKKHQLNLPELLLQDYLNGFGLLEDMHYCIIENNLKNNIRQI